MTDIPAIEKNVPPPGERRPRNVPLYPWPQMKAGDSFTVQGRVNAAAARGSFARYQKLGKIPASWQCVQWTEADGVVRFWAMEK